MAGLYEASIAKEMQESGNDSFDLGHARLQLALIIDQCSHVENVVSMIVGFAEKWRGDPKARKKSCYCGGKSRPRVHGTSSHQMG